MLKTVYAGEYLTINFDKEKSLFIQTWTKGKQLTMEVFKISMLQYTECYDRYRPRRTMWIQEFFSLELGSKEFQWIEEHVNIPCFGYGNKKCAFVVGKQIAQDISVMKSFDEPISVIVPRYFGTEKEAIGWLLSEKIEVQETHDLSRLEMTLSNTENGQSTFEISSPSSNIKETVLLLDSVLKKERFRNENFELYDELTKKEREVLRFLAQGETVAEISQISSVSIHTVRAHVRKLKQKLNCNRESELVKFGLMF
ncbi:MAG: helix-turn-helix transcriptional regulator [Crocinitomicaceae bacterium]|nr:helix-turn-helix transcriptional regulator [Crocinitomicaceae bacterium]